MAPYTNSTPRPVTNPHPHTRGKDGEREMDYRVVKTDDGFIVKMVWRDGSEHEYGDVSRQALDRLASLFGAAIGRRLTYKDLIA